MDEEIIPVIEVRAEVSEGVTDDEIAHYECAFHILPTVADEEVPKVVDELGALAVRFGGIVTGEETLLRYDLAYEIIKQVDGVNRRFNAAHFGWMRCTLIPAVLPEYLEELKHKPEILRYLVIRLTTDEIQRPFSIAALRPGWVGGETQKEGGEDGEIAAGTTGETGKPQESTTAG